MDSLKMYGGIVLRHGLSYLSAHLIATGWFTNEQGDYFVGSMMGLAAIGLSVYSKFRAKKKAAQS